MARGAGGCCSALHASPHDRRSGAMTVTAFKFRLSWWGTEPGRNERQGISLGTTNMAPDVARTSDGVRNLCRIDSFCTEHVTLVCFVKYHLLEVSIHNIAHR